MTISSGQQNLSCGVERSRSGEGAHLWIFFEEAIPCVTARKLGSALLTEAMEQEGKLKLDSYNRMFPNQDTLPNGGFGNLIALPLQGQARKKGNSEFVDEAFQPYQDQWAYLSEIQRLNTEVVEALIKTHSRGDALGDLCVTEPISKPWERKRKPSLTAMDFHGVQRIVRSNMLYIPADGFSREGPGNCERKHGKTEILRSRGTTQIRFHQKFTVIDGQTVWYGSVNFLSFGTAEESIMRFTSHDMPDS